MSNYTNLKNAIQSVIKANGNNEITGPILQAELLSMITTLGVGYQYMGVAQPSTNPGTPDARVMYFAYFPGTYVNFGGLTVTGFCVLKYDTVWTKENIPISGGGGGADFLTEPDDLTLEAVENTNILKFANRSYNSQNPNGLGYKILRGGLTFAEQITDANTIYEIRYEFDLQNQDVTIPENCVLKFNGGKLSNGNLAGYQYEIDSDTVCLENITFDSSFVFEIHSKWFVPRNKLSKQNSLIDCAAYLQDWINCGAKNLYLDAGIYYVENTLTVGRRLTICGDGYDEKAKQTYPENYWRNAAIIFTDKNLPVINFVLGTGEDYFQAFTIKRFGVSNINLSPNSANIPIVKVDVSGGLWGANFDIDVFGAIATGTNTYNYVGYQFNLSGVGYMGLTSFGGKMDRLKRAFEFNKISGATGFNNGIFFNQIVSNCDQYIYGPEMAAEVRIDSKIQMNVNQSSFFNDACLCEIIGKTYWNAIVFDYGGSGSNWSARYLLKCANQIVNMIDAPEYAFLRTSGTPSSIPPAPFQESVNTVKTNSLLALLAKNSGVTVESLTIVKDNVDITTKFERNQILEFAGSDCVGNLIGAALTASTNVIFTIVLAFNSTGKNYLPLANLFIKTKDYTNKKIKIDYYNSSNSLIGSYENVSTDNDVSLPLPKNPTNIATAKATFICDTLINSYQYIPIPALGIDSNYTTNNFQGEIFNTPFMNRVAMSVLDNNSPLFEIFNTKKNGVMSDDNATTFVYLCTQRYYHSALGGQSFRTIIDAQGKAFDFTIASYNQGNNPVFNIYGNSKNNQFDIAIVLNTTSADNPFVEFDVFVKRYTRYVSFVITDMKQWRRYNEYGEVFRKSTEPTISDVSTAKFKRSIGTIGATSERPVYPIAGDEFFDTDLLKKILWNGSAWVNMDGTPLS